MAKKGTKKITEVEDVKILETQEQSETIDFNKTQNKEESLEEVIVETKPKESKRKEFSDNEVYSLFNKLSLSVRNDYNLKNKLGEILSHANEDTPEKCLRYIIDNELVLDDLTDKEFIRRAKEDLK